MPVVFLNYQRIGFQLEKVLSYTVASPARGLLNKEKREKDAISLETMSVYTTLTRSGKNGVTMVIVVGWRSLGDIGWRGQTFFRFRHIISRSFT